MRGKETSRGDVHTVCYEKGMKEKQVLIAICNGNTTCREYIPTTNKNRQNKDREIKVLKAERKGIAASLRETETKEDSQVIERTCSTEKEKVFGKIKDFYPFWICGS